jgi:hypothetical protein
MLVPGSGGPPAAGAACLAVGALALLAGHTWGLLVVVPAHVVLVGRLWPTIALSGASVATAGETLAVAVVLATLVPTLAFSAFTLPAVVGHLLPERTRRARSLVVAVGALALAAALVLPALTTPASAGTQQAAQASPPAETGAAIVDDGR